MIKSINQNDLLIVLILLLSGLKYTFGIEAGQDIDLVDEGLYLYRGVTLLNNGLPSPDWGPLYSVWYFMLSFLQPDRIELFYLNHKLVMILLPIVLYLALRRTGIRLLASMIISFFFLISYANLFSWPWVTYLALLMILTTFIFTSYLKYFQNKLAVFCVSALLSSYVRPELFLTFILLSLSYLGVIAYTFKKKRHAVTVTIGIFLLSGFLIQFFGFPIQGGNKSYLTFQQHFSKNWVVWTNSDLSSVFDYEIILKKSFGNIHSISEALFNNPVLFMKHIVSNLMQTPRKLAGSFFCHSNILLPPIPSMIENYLLLGLALLYSVFSKNIILSRVITNIKTNKGILFFTSCYLVSSFIVIVVFYPRDHHLLLAGTLMIIMIASLLVSQNERQEHFNYKQLLLIGLIFISVTPQALSSTGSYTKKNYETIKFIDSLNITEKATIMGAEGFYFFYLSSNFQGVPAWIKRNDPFFSFLKKHRINLIILSKQLLNDWTYKDDNEWKYFLSTFEDFGYIKLDIPNTDRELIIAKNLIESSRELTTPVIGIK